MKIFLWALALTLAVLTASSQARAQASVAGGVGVGAFQVGKGEGIFAISPHVTLGLWRGAWLLEGQYQATLVPERNGMGHMHRVTLGGGGKVGDVTAVASASLTAYRLVTCDIKCGPVLGVAAGAQVRVTYQVAGPLGLMVSSALDYFGGKSLALRAAAAVTVMAGPVFRY